MWNNKFDVAVLGSGLGGASAAYELSKAGLKVLVIERGPWPYRDADDWNAQKILLKSRYAGSDPVEIRQYGRSDFKPTSMNENVGGMSVFYGGAAFRLRERDFDRWPLNYQSFEAAYGKAEELLEVHGRAGEDPCEPYRSSNYPYEPIPLNPPAERIQAAAQSLGLHPFRIPLAINFKNTEKQQCAQCHTCDGYPCKIGAKSDATSILTKAMKHQPPPQVVTGILIDRLEWEGDRVRAAQAVDVKSGERFSIRAELFVVSGGSIGSAGILLRSALDEKFPHAHFIGKNLMRHCNAVVSYVFPFKTNPQAIFHKQIAISHFYEDLRDTQNYATGVIQDIYTPERRVVSAFAPKGFKWLAGVFSEHIQSLLCVAEDEAQESNRVSLSEKKDRFGIQQLQIHHEYTRGDYYRRNYLIEQARKILKKAGGKMSRLMEIDSFSHAVGTLRFGKNDREGVLDLDCKFFGLKNLYVLDGSFMPSSGGVNPSLSITANSLRVSEKILGNHSEWRN